MIFVIKKISPGKLNIEPFRRAMLNAVEAEAMIERNQLRKTTATWQGDKPTFTSETSIKGGNLTVITGPAGNAMGAKKWVWLDQGTRVRYATMSGDWRSKTRVKWFGSGPGKGRMLFVNRRRPRPGIQARGWSEALTLTRKNAFRKLVMDGLARATRRMWAK